MVAEIAGSTIVLIAGATAAFAAAVVMMDAAGTYDTDSVSNLSVGIWDRFGDSGTVWGVITLTYRGGPLEMTGDINVCFVPADGITCRVSGLPPKPNCGNNTHHGCWRSETAGGSAVRVTYEGVVAIGYDVVRGDPLGYVVRSGLHSGAGTVTVR